MSLNKTETQQTIKTMAAMTITFLLYHCRDIFSACAVQQLVDCPANKICIAVAVDCPADAPCRPRFVAHCVDTGESIACRCN